MAHDTGGEVAGGHEHIIISYNFTHPRPRTALFSTLRSDHHFHTMLSRVAVRSRPVTQAALARTTPATVMSSRRMYATSKPDDAKADKVKSITVFGAGLMGGLPSPGSDGWIIRS
jgi:hypothetical protein